jgi:hypothetical protein
MRRHGSAGYFDLHDELDPSHAAMAIEPLRRQTPETLARVRVIVEQAWRMLDTCLERMAALVLGAAEPGFYTAELR